MCQMQTFLMRYRSLACYTTTPKKIPREECAEILLCARETRYKLDLMIILLVRSSKTCFDMYQWHSQGISLKGLSHVQVKITVSPGLRGTDDQPKYKYSFAQYVMERILLLLAQKFFH